jgi:hypothetical protein
MITKDFINDIREEIAAKIQGSSTLFQHISAFPKTTIDGFPAVIVMLSENDVAFASTGSQDSRKISLIFSLNVYYPATKEAEQEKAEKAMGEAVSELMRVFCVKKPLTKCDLAKVGLTPWGETTVGEATYRTAQVLLTCATYVDTV